MTDEISELLEDVAHARIIKSNVIPMIKAGMKPPVNPPWLLTLGINTSFLAQMKGDDTEVIPEFKIINVTDTSVLLRTITIHKIFFWVNPELFSSRYELVEILRQY